MGASIWSSSSCLNIDPDPGLCPKAGGGTAKSKTRNPTSAVMHLDLRFTILPLFFIGLFL